MSFSGFYKSPLLTCTLILRTNTQTLGATRVFKFGSTFEECCQTELELWVHTTKWRYTSEQCTSDMGNSTARSSCPAPCSMLSSKKTPLRSFLAPTLRPSEITRRSTDVIKSHIHERWSDVGSAMSNRQRQTCANFSAKITPHRSMPFRIKQYMYWKATFFLEMSLLKAQACHTCNWFSAHKERASRYIHSCQWSIAQEWHEAILRGTVGTGNWASWEIHFAVLNERQPVRRARCHRLYQELIWNDTSGRYSCLGKYFQTNMRQDSSLGIAWSRWSLKLEKFAWELRVFCRLVSAATWSHSAEQVTNAEYFDFFWKMRRHSENETGKKSYDSLKTTSWSEITKTPRCDPRDCWGSHDWKMKRKKNWKMTQLQVLHRLCTLDITLSKFLHSLHVLTSMSFLLSWYCHNSSCPHEYHAKSMQLWMNSVKRRW